MEKIIDAFFSSFMSAVEAIAWMFGGTLPFAMLVAVVVLVLNWLDKKEEKCAE